MRRSIIARLLAGLVITAMGWAVSSALAAQPPVQVTGLWQDINLSALKQSGSLQVQQITATQGRYLRLDVLAMQALLSQAPGPSVPGAMAPDASSAGLELVLPLPDGSMQRFAIVEAPVMAPELAARYPAIKTYRGQGLDDPSASVFLDMTPQGFHAMLLRPAGAVYIDPLYQQQNDLYISYNKADLVVDPARLAPELPPLEAPPGTLDLPQPLPQAPSTASGTQLRTYRLALAATGEYTQYHGGTKELGLAAMVTAMQRVNGIYQTEVAVHMQLVANNDLIIYTNPATDPYTNSNPSYLLNENQANLDTVLGNAAYDIGHVFSTGGGGLAYLGTPCNGSIKARGETGLSNPTGDAFWVDYVAHEMGHQFSAQHTFNGNDDNCRAPNRWGPDAFEPGSGSTIMAYAGICDSQNLQPNSDPYFHTISFQEIVAYTTLGTGSSCPATTPTSNRPPEILLAATGYTIPKNTPFFLSGAASDPDGDPLTYQWEQVDAGPVAGAPPGVTGAVTPPALPFVLTHHQPHAHLPAPAQYRQPEYFAGGRAAHWFDQPALPLHRA